MGWDLADPVATANGIVDKKARNLEKRKVYFVFFFSPTTLISFSLLCFLVYNKLRCFLNPFLTCFFFYNFLFNPPYRTSFLERAVPF